MKKNIITAAVLFMICLSNVKAQDSVKVTASVAKNFESGFYGASKVEWTKTNNTFVARFRYQDDLWLAYFSSDGDMIASGRKIGRLDQLPIQVRKGILQEKNQQEKKFGSLDTSYAVEMIEQGTTNYYLPMENSRISLIVSAGNSGSTTIHKKEIKRAPANPARDLIAKNN